METDLDQKKFAAETMVMLVMVIRLSDSQTAFLCSCVCPLCSASGAVEESPDRRSVSAGGVGPAAGFCSVLQIQAR